MSLKIYIAARFSRRHECHALGQELEKMGHKIVSRWSSPDSDHVKPDDMTEAADHEQSRFAIEDLEDIDKCDLFISLMEKPRSNGRGGRHVEFGYAIAKGKSIMIIGPRETVFHHIGFFVHFDTVSDFLIALSK